MRSEGAPFDTRAYVPPGTAFCGVVWAGKRQLRPTIVQVAPVSFFPVLRRRRRRRRHRHSRRSFFDRLSRSSVRP